jgi:hypothetical protein
LIKLRDEDAIASIARIAEREQDEVDIVSDSTLTPAAELPEGDVATDVADDQVLGAATDVDADNQPEV